MGSFFKSHYIAIFLAIICSVMLMLTALLVMEYRFFVKELDELTQLKQEYDNYLLLFKRMILQEENQEVEKDDNENVEKKKMNNSVDESPFLLVNRDAAYLHDVAARFGKEHKLEDAVTSMYKRTSMSLPNQVRSSTAKKKSKRGIGKRSQRQLTLTQEFRSDLQDIVREMEFCWPIEKKLFWISYGFGPRKHPNGTWEFHRGIDLAAPKGTPVAAAAKGQVVQAGYAGGYGNVVVIAHNKKFATRYAHLSKVLVTVGDELCQGDILGKVGATGNVRGKNGAHLHFEIMIYGKRVNPFYFLT